MKTLLIILLSATAYAQTIIPNGTGGGGGGGSSTANAIRSGLLADIPATCDVADIYYATDASILTGLWRIYTCTATNTWTATGVQAGASGALECESTTANQTICDVVAGIFVTLSGSNTLTGSYTRTNSTDKPPATVFASLPAAAGNSGDVYIVTDCLTAACAAGGGSVRVWMRSNGSSYDVVSPGTTYTPPALGTSGAGGFWASGAMPEGQAESAAYGDATLYFFTMAPAPSGVFSRLATYELTTGSGQYVSWCVYNAATEALVGGTTPVLVTSSATNSVRNYTFSPAITLTESTAYVLSWAASGTAAWKFWTGNSSSTIGAQIINYVNGSTGAAPTLPRIYTTGQTMDSPGSGQTCPASISGTKTSFAIQAPAIYIAP